MAYLDDFRLHFSENIDFELVTDENIDFVLDFVEYYDFEVYEVEEIKFVLDKTNIVDFELDLTIPIEEYEPVFAEHKPDNVRPYGCNLITEDECILMTEDGCYLTY